MYSNWLHCCSAAILSRGRFMNIMSWTHFRRFRQSIVPSNNNLRWGCNSARRRTSHPHGTCLHSCMGC